MLPATAVLPRPALARTRQLATSRGSPARHAVDGGHPTSPERVPRVPVYRGDRVRDDRAFRFHVSRGGNEDLVRVKLVKWDVMLLSSDARGAPFAPTVRTRTLAPPPGSGICRPYKTPQSPEERLRTPQPHPPGAPEHCSAPAIKRMGGRKCTTKQYLKGPPGIKGSCFPLVGI